MTFGERILKFRKELNLTQNDVAEKLYVTFQAVSQWENGISKPDIEMLPKLAKVLNKSIDELFHDEVTEESQFGDLEDGKLYIVVAKGKNLVKVVNYQNNIKDNIEIKIEGDAVNVQSYFSVTVDGNVQGSISAGNCVTCDTVYSSVNAGNCVTCDSVYGSVSAGNCITCDDICGSVSVGNDLTCENINGDVNVTGNIECDTIDAEYITCEGDIKCKNKTSDNSKIII